MTFPTELGILTCLMILAASLWIPQIVGTASLKPEDLPDTGAGVAGGPHGRLHRPHLLDRNRIFLAAGCPCGGLYHRMDDNAAAPAHLYRGLGVLPDHGLFGVCFRLSVNALGQDAAHLRQATL